MLQVDHIYEFFYSTFDKNIDVHYFYKGTIEKSHYHVFKGNSAANKILFYDQEPLVDELANFYFAAFNAITSEGYWHWVLSDGSHREIGPMTIMSNLEQGLPVEPGHQFGTVITSERSALLDQLCSKYSIQQMYYFYHGFAALDWYRGFYALNYHKPVTTDYKYDFISFNRLISNDRSYRCYFVSKLIENDLLSKGQISFGLDNEHGTWQDEIASPKTKLSNKAVTHIKQHLTKIQSPLIVDSPNIQGWASADIPRCSNDSFWHIVTETVFYYNKLHLTEKIFKPIVMKQPFMLIAAPGNLAYLKSYGFKTFDGIIDESYDLIEDPDLRIEAVVTQLQWYCSLPAVEKQKIIEQIAPIVEYNFHHFYTQFKFIIVDELLNNLKTLFKDLNYNDNHIDYTSISHVLTN